MPNASRHACLHLFAAAHPRIQRVLWHVRPMQLSARVGTGSCCSRRPIPVNNSLFEGEVRVWIAGLPTTPDCFATEVRRKTSHCCDGNPEVTLRAVDTPVSRSCSEATAHRLHAAAGLGSFKALNPAQTLVAGGPASAALPCDAAGPLQAAAELRRPPDGPGEL